MSDPLPTPPTMQLARSYDSTTTHDLLDILGYTGRIAAKGTPAPIQVGKRWPGERTHAWMNGDGKLRRCTDKHKHAVAFYLYRAATPTMLHRLPNQARSTTAGRPDPPPAASADHHLPDALRCGRCRPTGRGPGGRTRRWSCTARCGRRSPAAGRHPGAATPRG